MGCVWLMSDIHFGHRAICKYRKDFQTREEHDETVFNNIVNTVRKKDILWLLGDCCFDEASYEKIAEISKAVSQLNYIPGNHDTDNSVRLEMYKKMVIDGLLHKTGSMFKLNELWLTHAPIHPDELRGKVNVHGHTHNVEMMREIVSYENFVWVENDPRYYNVCVEHTDYKPIKLQTIRENLKK